MNLRPALLVCSSDDAMIRCVTAAVTDDGIEVLTASGWAGAAERMRVHYPAAAVVDVRCDEVYRRLDEWPSLFPDVPVIVFGMPRTERVLHAARLDVFASADPSFGFREWQQLIRLAVRHHRVRLEVRDLKARPEPVPASAPENLPPPPPAPAPAGGVTGSIMQHVAGAFRHFEHVDLMLDRALEGLSAAAMTTRAGLFAPDEKTGIYRLRAGQRYMRETAGLTYPPDDPLVQWFERHAHMISRPMAAGLRDAAESRLLLRTLDLAGADIIAPLHARGRLLGWIFLGARSTGQPYSLRDLEELSMAADYIAMLLENALLYREVTVQKSMAETLLHSLPTGIVAVDGGGIVRWFSTAAEQMLGRTREEVTGRPAETLGTRLADAVRNALSGRPSEPGPPWEEPVTGRYLRLETRPLGGQADGFGAVLLIQDQTAIRRMQEKQEELERAAFWTDLAAGLSHEIRNPLVTIRTFAQLLPERYQDDEFREEFSSLVGQEVERLGALIDQINDFAHPPEPRRRNTDVRELLQAAFARVFKDGAGSGVDLRSEFEGNLPMVHADDRALTDSLEHLFRNAAESMAATPHPKITCSARMRNGGSRDRAVEISITDNGRGIPEEVMDKVFSPFYTTKARGMGLGLPIVKRTVIEHNGHVDIHSGGEGTSVVISLPVDAEQTPGDAT